ncbi:MAG TPA: NAD(P)H-dependent oxidoreductase [Candidatus Paceibacterota bacterium]|jgi:putative NADPH-quinone reductase
MAKKIYILLGHPDKETFSGHLADLYAEAAQAAGHEVRRTNVGDLSFDPILHKGYKVIQELEPDLKQVQEDMKWADHFVLIYPIWWSAMPALLKGMWDRMFIPGFAFRFHKRESWHSIPGWDKLLKGKTARVIALSKSQPWQIRLLFGDFTNEISRATLGFAGYRVSRTHIGNAEKLSDTKRMNWERYIGVLGRRGA